MTGADRHGFGIDRRRFLSLTGISATSLFAGCASDLTGTTEEQEETEMSEEPIYKPSPETTDNPVWKGGHRKTESRGAQVYTKEFRISVPFAYASPQLGVYFGEPVEENREEIPNGEFQWLEAADESYIWTPYVEVKSEQSGYGMEPKKLASQVPVGSWYAKAAGDGDSPDVHPFATAFDSSPTYYRIITRTGTRTLRAYTTTERSHRGGRFLAFEIPDRMIHVTFYDDVRVRWGFDF